MPLKIDTELVAQSSLDTIDQKAAAGITLAYQVNQLLKLGHLPTLDRLKWLASGNRLTSWADVIISQLDLEIDELKRAGKADSRRRRQAESKILGPARQDLARFWPRLIELGNDPLAGQLRMESLRAMHMIEGPTRPIVSAIRRHDDAESAKRAWAIYLRPLRR